MSAETFIPRASRPSGRAATDLHWRRAAVPPLVAALLHQATLLAILAFMTLPALTPAAVLARWLFPAQAMFVAGWLFLRGRSGLFVTFCLWLFLLTPCVRRMVDAHAGYSDANVLMLAPYVAASWSALHAPRLLLAPGRPAQWPLTLLLVACVYGFLKAVAEARYLPAVLDLLRWSTPPLLGGYIIVQSKDWREICDELRALTLVATPIVSLYAVYQYVALPKWDALWMINTQMGSIGFPRPFEVRVFGTMNSPASLAYYLGALILISLCLKTPLRWAGASLGAAALAVTLVRSAWLGLAAGLILLLARAPPRARMSVILVGSGLLLAAPLVLSNARVEHMLAQRFETLTNLGGDLSFTTRSAAYATAWDDLVQQPWGAGFGTAGVAAKFASQSRIIDGGPIEVLVALGLVFGFAYLAMALVLGAAAAMRRPPQTGRDIWAAAQAILLAQFLAFSSVTTTIGEIGVLFWLATGLLLAAPLEDRRSGAGSARPREGERLRRTSTEGRVAPAPPRSRLSPSRAAARL